MTPLTDSTAERTASDGAQVRAADRDTAARRLVLAGAAAAPLLLVVWLVQAAYRPGYDLTRHPMSLLALGDGGAVQVASFVITGLLVLALARGFRLRWTDGTGARAIPILVALMGVGLIAAGVFPVDAGAGFPAGAPAGAPELTPTGIAHELGYALVMGSYTVATAVLVIRFRRARDHRALAASVAVLVLVAVLAALPHTESLPIRLAIAGALPLAFLAGLARRRPMAPRPGAAAALSTRR